MKQLRLKKASTLTYNIYDFFTKSAENEERIYSAQEICERFDINERTLRQHIRYINEQTTCGSFEKIIASNKFGYYVLKESEAIDYLEKAWRLAVTYIEKARYIEKKLSLNGQTKLKLGKYYSETYKSTV